MNFSGHLSPLVEIAARVGWCTRISEIVYGDPPYLIMQSIPVFPGCHGELIELGIVWDVLDLIDSIKRPGAYQLLTCECGYAPDAGLDERVLVSHLDAHTVIWELDIPGLRPALDNSFADVTAGFIRLVFRREEYESDIRAMVSELQCVAKTTFSAHPETDAYGLQQLLRSHDFPFPITSTIMVEELEPNTKGLALECLLETNTSAPWEQEPIWPRNTVVEFGFFRKGDGHELMKVDGSDSVNCWPGWYFTRWQALEAFRVWLSFVDRSWTISIPGKQQAPAGAGTNEFVLLLETDRVLCHSAGKRFAKVMQSCCNEGNTAPDVAVLYVETTLQCAVNS